MFRSAETRIANALPTVPRGMRRRFVRALYAANGWAQPKRRSLDTDITAVTHAYQQASRATRPLLLRHVERMGGVVVGFEEAR